MGRHFGGRHRVRARRDGPGRSPEGWSHDLGVVFAHEPPVHPRVHALPLREDALEPSRRHADQQHAGLGPDVPEGVHGPAGDEHDRPGGRAHDALVEPEAELPADDVEELVRRPVDVGGRPALGRDGLAEQAERRPGLLACRQHLGDVRLPAPGAGEAGRAVGRDDEPLSVGGEPRLGTEVRLHGAGPPSARASGSRVGWYRARSAPRGRTEPPAGDEGVKARSAWVGRGAISNRDTTRKDAMWTAESRALVGDFGAGQALSDEQYALLVPLIPAAKPGGRPRTTDMRRLLDGLFYLVRTGCPLRHLPPPPAFPPWRTVYGYMRDFADAGVWESIRHHLVLMLREREGREPSPSAAIVDTRSVKTTEKGGLAATTRRRRSRAGSATSRSTPWGCCSASPSTPPTSRTRTAWATSSRA